MAVAGGMAPVAEKKRGMLNSLIGPLGYRFARTYQGIGATAPMRKNQRFP